MSWTPEELKRQYGDIEEKVDALEVERSDLEQQRNVVGREIAKQCKTLEEIEQEWHKTHSCSCGLLGMPCSH